MTLSGIAERLLYFRANQSRAAFAKYCGISRPSLVNYEEGRIPGSEEVLKIASATNVTLDWLLMGEGPMRQGETESPQAGGSPLVASELSEEGRRLLQLYFRLPVDVRREFIGGIRFVLGREKDKDLDREIAELLDVIEKAGQSKLRHWVIKN